MCRRKPGRRCPKHCHQELEAALVDLRTLLAQTNTPPELVTAARDEMRLRQADLDSTGTVRAHHADLIASLSTGPLLPGMVEKKREYQRSLAIGEALAQERIRQLALMPDYPDNAAARHAYHALGEARDGMARYAVQAEIAGTLDQDRPRQERFEKLHRDAAAEALDAHTRLRIALARGEANQKHLTSAERDAYLRGDSATRAAYAYRSHRAAVLADNAGAFDSPHTPLPEETLPPVPGETDTDRITRLGGIRATLPTEPTRRDGYQRRLDQLAAVTDRWVNSRKQSGSLRRLRESLGNIANTGDTGGPTATRRDQPSPADPTGILTIFDLLTQATDQNR